MPLGSSLVLDPNKEPFYCNLFCYLWKCDISIRNSCWSVPDPSFEKKNKTKKSKNQNQQNQSSKSTNKSQYHFYCMIAISMKLYDINMFFKHVSVFRFCFASVWTVCKYDDSVYDCYSVIYQTQEYLHFY